MWTSNFFIPTISEQTLMADGTAASTGKRQGWRRSYRYIPLRNGYCRCTTRPMTRGPCFLFLSITVSVWCEDNKAFTSIADQGIGIPKPALAKVFDRFYRVDNASRNSQIGGTGLGLSIAYDIMKLHKGDIVVTSDGKTGSTFTLSFPYSDEINQENNDWEDFAE